MNKPDDINKPTGPTNHSGDKGPEGEPGNTNNSMSNLNYNDADHKWEQAFPTWEEITPTLLQLIQEDNDEAAKAAMIDLRTMAQLADKAAHLIAVVPELLESLKDLENILSCKPYDRDEQELLNSARAAIAKAETKET